MSNEVVLLLYNLFIYIIVFKLIKLVQKL